VREVDSLFGADLTALSMTFMGIADDAWPAKAADAPARRKNAVRQPVKFPKSVGGRLRSGDGRRPQPPRYN
jgi:hypothetical protein